VAPIIRTIVSVLADTLFMVICEKLLAMVICVPPPPGFGGGSGGGSGKTVLQLNPNVVCWEGEHAALACVALICFGVYLPLSAMIGEWLLDAALCFSVAVERERFAPVLVRCVCSIC
jgi:hypothetical protein